VPTPPRDRRWLDDAVALPASGPLPNFVDNALETDAAYQEAVEQAWDAAAMEAY